MQNGLLPLGWASVHEPAEKDPVPEVAHEIAPVGPGAEDPPRPDATAVHSKESGRKLDVAQNPVVVVGVFAVVVVIVPTKTSLRYPP